MLIKLDLSFKSDFFSPLLLQGIVCHKKKKKALFPLAVKLKPSKKLRERELKVIIRISGGFWLGCEGLLSLHVGMLQRSARSKALLSSQLMYCLISGKIGKREIQLKFQ